MFVDQMQKGARRMRALLQGLRDYWSVDRLDRPLATNDLSDVLESTLRNLKPAIEESAAEITTQTLPELQVPETPLLEILQNLLENAVKYRRAGVAPRIRLSARQVGGEWEFAVADNGIGIPAKHREAIFQPFKRLHGDETPGAGMGLAICSRIVSRMGGRIWVESDEAGSTFRFTLPLESQG